jgi:hypothetical protein
MARYMRETGVAAKLKLPQRDPLPTAEVQKALEARITAATVSSEDGLGILIRSVTQVSTCLYLAGSRLCCGQAFLTLA